ncbi:hypothetical protein Zmor_008328 [Zophobas morio]|uniref:ribonuclease H n=1 Tax=Zophobas morio TaxID=2755281 RepID=A0AA38J134_9CUCU|nr:hypothetical protein Zmor_008328 [Zophobas morio]
MKHLWRFFAGVDTTQTTQTMSIYSTPVVVYADGSFRNKKCGIGVYFPGDKSFSSREVSKVIDHHKLTNQVAELAACINAIEIAQEVGIQHLEVRTDSQYVVNSMSKWIHQWKPKNWKKIGKNCDIENKDLIMKLDDLCASTKVDWVHIPRNANKKANDLAQKATKHL